MKEIMITNYGNKHMLRKSSLSAHNETSSVAPDGTYSPDKSNRGSTAVWANNLPPERKLQY
jgi:hypothetical protein